MRKVAVLLLGVSFPSLYVLKELEARHIHDVLAVDVKPRIGGILAPIQSILGTISLIPVVSECNTKNQCIDSEVIMVKQGDYLSKLVGYTNPDEYQRLWLKEWLEIFSRGKVTIDLNPLEKAPRLTKPRIVTNIRKIDIDKKVAALSNGTIIMFERLISSWPLDILLSKLTKVPSSCLELKHHLNYVSAHLSIFIEKLEEHLDKAYIYIHATKASRFHTALKIPLTQPYAVTYVFTSFSHAYPLLPGITEKILSEMRKFKIVNEHNIVDERHVVITYFALSKAPKDLLEQCIDELRSEGIDCVSRLSVWREMALHELRDLAVSLAKNISI